MIKQFATLIISTLVIAGCQATQAASSTGTTSPTASTNPVSSPKVEPSISPTSAPSLPSPERSKDIADETISKTYRINKNYDVVPIDPSGNKKVILLTFDDGPKDKKMIDPLIDTLDKHKAKAIFFTNGYRIKANPDLLKLIHDRGQIIGNHSWDHIDLKKEKNEKIDQQLDDVQKIVKDLIGTAPIFFRPPFGSSNEHVKEKVKEDKMLFMTWSNGSLDWDSKNFYKPAAIIKNVMDQLHPGSNILMHELPWTVEALDSLLTQLEEKGYTFVDPRSIQTEE